MDDLFDDLEKTITLFRDIVRELPDRYNQNNHEIETLQSERQDILHALEFTSFSASKGYKLSKDIKEVQINRRIRKNENEILEPIIPLLKKFRGQLQEMDKIVGEVRKIKKSQGNRTYRCRVREDLQESFDKQKVVSI